MSVLTKIKVISLIPINENFFAWFVTRIMLLAKALLCNQN
jgi:hypothetical protein